MLRISITNRGFTIVELMVVVVVVGLLSAVIFGPLSNLYSAFFSAQQKIVQTTDTQNALNSIEHEIAIASGFYAANSVADPMGPNNNADGVQWRWDGSNSGGGASSRVLITGSYATSILENLDTTGARTLIYSSPGCITPVVNNKIYFVKNGSLYRRTLKNPGSTCSSMAQRQTCAAGVTNAACAGTDAKIVSGVTNFTINYYQTPSDSNTIANQYTDTSVPSSAGTVVVSLSTRVGNGNNATTSSASLRITRLNGSAYTPPPAHDSDLQEFTTPGAYTYTIPAWCSTVDVILLGGGGGGNSGAILWFNGGGGGAGNWIQVRLTRGTNIPLTTTTISGSVGGGGWAGTVPAFVPNAGNGGTTTATGTGMASLSATGGTGGRYQGSTQVGASPGTEVFDGQTYFGGAAQSYSSSNGNAPGGGAAGGDGHFAYGDDGGAGAAGQAWFYAYQ